MENVTLKKMINAYGMVLILILLFLALSVSIDGFFSARTVWSIIEQVSMFGIIAIGVTSSLSQRVSIYHQAQWWRLQQSFQLQL